jgi:hypothetical protein
MPWHAPFPYQRAVRWPLVQDGFFNKKFAWVIKTTRCHGFFRDRWILSSLELDLWNNIFDKNHQTKGKLMEELYQLFPFACYKVRDIRLKGRLSSNMPNGNSFFISS